MPPIQAQFLQTFRRGGQIHQFAALFQRGQHHRRHVRIIFDGIGIKPADALRAAEPHFAVRHDRRRLIDKHVRLQAVALDVEPRFAGRNLIFEQAFVRSHPNIARPILTHGDNRIDRKPVAFIQARPLTGFFVEQIQPAANRRHPERIRREFVNIPDLVRPDAGRIVGIVWIVRKRFRRRVEAFHARAIRADPDDAVLILI